jgi:hypothetical protein
VGRAAWLQIAKERVGLGKGWSDDMTLDIKIESFQSRYYWPDSN